ncbi:GNAT family N-acetyltransferase [Paenibacillus chartarius]|uniref:GNAT family N-acetyltransferase n=1 Tax=Paenibacillus chartarius TaxID=747481 RepID=A0ABV6DFZ3_9BACL
MFTIRKITDENCEDLGTVRNELYRYNQINNESASYEPFNFIVYDENEAVIAGLLSHRFGEAVFLDILWVEEGRRGQGIGRMLLQQLEMSAKESGANLIHLDTFDFHAPEFYWRHGYVTFGILENTPLQGNKRYFMKKDI